MNNVPPNVQLIEFLALMDKLQIQFNSSLSPIEKEILKQGIDEIKRIAYQS